MTSLQRFSSALILTATIAQLVGLYSGWLSSPAGAIFGINITLTVITFFAYWIVSRSEDARTFTQIYLVTIVIKIIATCGLAVALVFLDPSNARPNVVFLLILYLIYTVIEVAFLVASRRADRP